MDALADLPVHELSSLLAQHEHRSLLRFITCGSVDDGKSTLIGRLLFESKRVFEDQLAALEHDSRHYGSCEGGIDFALLLDGLAAEREQGITIDVAYRFFDTASRKFIVADCPGHIQYTRNMATGASTADAAVVLVDARAGLQEQTFRHTYILSLLGVPHIILAINKMDLVDYAAVTCQTVQDAYERFCVSLGFSSVQCIPVAALHGDNLSKPSPHMPWYAGPTLLQALERAPVTRAETGQPLRLPVQWVNRTAAGFRDYAGTIAAGQVRCGEAVVILPAGTRSRVTRLFGAKGETDSACAGQPVTFVLADQVDVRRGDVIAAADDLPGVADQFAAHLLWLDASPLLPGRQYLLRIGTRTVVASISEIRHRIDVSTQQKLAASRLEQNEVCYCTLALMEPAVFAPYAENRTLGSFILVDRHSNATVAAGRIEMPLRRSSNLHRQALDIDRWARARIKGQVPRVLWFTGLSGAGKSTVANAVDKRLHAAGYHTCVLDGDNIRHGLCRDLGFTDEDRVENIRRLAEVARLMADAGLIVLVSCISPFAVDRGLARELVGEDTFTEIYVRVPLEVAERRDPKGLYRKARAGLLPNLTGVDSPYEAPTLPDLQLNAATETTDALATQVIDYLLARQSSTSLG